MRKAFATTIIAILCVINTTGFAIQYIGGNGHHTLHCPFMLGEEGMCNMTQIEHFSAWKDATQTALFSLTILFILLAYYLIPNKYNPTKKQSKHRYYSPPNCKNIFQILLSKGILNPRIP